MAFDLDYFVPLSAQANARAPRVFFYKEDTDALATIIAANYFLDANGQNTLGLQAGDIIRVFTTGAQSFELVVATASATAITVTLVDGPQTLTASGAVTAGVKVVKLAHATAAIAATIANASKHYGLFYIVATLEPGAGQDHTCTITTGSWNGTNKVATFADINDALLVHFDSAGAGTILVNTGSVALSG